MGIANMTRKSQNHTNTKPQRQNSSIHIPTVQFKGINMETRKKFVDNIHTYMWGQVVRFSKVLQTFVKSVVDLLKCRFSFSFFLKGNSDQKWHWRLI